MDGLMHYKWVDLMWEIVDSCDEKVRVGYIPY